MKGLFWKDICSIAAGGKNTLVAALVIVLFCVMNSDSGGLASSLILLTFFWSVVAINTVYSDMEHHGLSYLFTLPSGRAQYVTEKYLLSILPALAACGAAALILGLMENQTTLYATAFAMVLIISCLTTSVQVPAYLYFGADKARVVNLLIMTAVGVSVGMSASYGFSMIHVSAGVLLGASLGVCVILTGISAWISVKILERKQL